MPLCSGGRADKQQRTSDLQFREPDVLPIVHGRRVPVEVDVQLEGLVAAFELDGAPMEMVVEPVSGGESVLLAVADEYVTFLEVVFIHNSSPPIFVSLDHRQW